ncbi:MAG: hypothetical protein WCS20_03410 [Alphaproteobacteria bacterium]|jgi:hypothetical protein
MGAPDGGVPKTAYWNRPVQNRAPIDPGAPCTPHLPVSRRQRVTAADYRFARHIGHELGDAALRITDAEPLA